MTPRFVIASFLREQDVLAGTRAARAAGYDVVDVYTPYAVHGLDQALGVRPSRLTWVCFLGGLIGVVAALWLQFWTSSTSWPINVGGKPFDSLPAFIPIAFEICILFAGMGVVLALLIRCGLRPGRAADIPAPGATDDRFVLVARLESAVRDAEHLRALLSEHGAVALSERIGKEER